MNTMRGGDEVVPGDHSGSADDLSIPEQCGQPRELAGRDGHATDHTRASGHPACCRYNGSYKSVVLFFTFRLSRK